MFATARHPLGCDLDKGIGMKKIGLVCVFVSLFPVICVASQKNIGNWTLVTTRDALTNSTERLAITFQNRRGDDPFLAISCEDNTTRVWVTTEDFIVRTGLETSVKYRIGNNKIRSESWMLVNTIDGTVSTEGRNAVNFLRKLDNHQKVIMRVGGNDVNFQIGGISQILDIILPACGNRR